MYPHSRREDNNNNKNNSRKTKAISAIPMAGVVVSAALLLGLLFFISSSYHTAIAQQNMTEGNANATIGTNSTTTAGGAAGGGNQSSTASQVRMHIEEACMAAQNNDTQGVLMHLNLALNALGRGTSAANDNCDDGVVHGSAATNPCNDYGADDEGA